VSHLTKTKTFVVIQLNSH